MGQRLVVRIFEDANTAWKEGNDKDNSLCSIYYHWSGYSTSSLIELNKIVNAMSEELEENSVGKRVYTSESKDAKVKIVLPNFKLIKFLSETTDENIKLDEVDRIQLIQFLIKSLERVGARIDFDEYNILPKLYKDIEFIKEEEELDRNNGLIAITESEQDKYGAYAEGYAYIYLKQRVVETDIFSYEFSKDDLEDTLKEWNGLTDEEVEDAMKNIEKIDMNPYDEVDFEDIEEAVELSREMDRKGGWFELPKNDEYSYITSFC